nr:YlxM family DNA-binding protein [Clostridioides mangenotii]
MCKVKELYSICLEVFDMNIEKMVEVGLLFEQYRELLTKKQREIVSLYYEEDYSLGEISENLGVSRQSVYDTLKRSEKILRDYEDKLQLVSKLQEHEHSVKLVFDEIVNLKENIKSKKDFDDLIPKLESIEDICRGMIK